MTPCSSVTLIRYITKPKPNTNEPKVSFFLANGVVLKATSLYLDLNAVRVYGSLWFCVRAQEMKKLRKGQNGPRLKVLYIIEETIYCVYLPNLKGNKL